MVKNIVYLIHHYLVDRRSRLHNVRPIYLLVALLLLSACSQFWDNPDGVHPLQIEPTSTVTTNATSASAGETRGGEPGSQQVVLWVPDFSGLAGNDNAGGILTGAFHQFEQANPGTRVDAQVKAENGTSGLVNYLRSAQRGAPSTMPDVALVNTQHLWQLADLGIATVISPDEMAQFGPFYQFALDAVSYNDLNYGIPYAANVLHVAYHLDQMEAPPITWNELLASNYEFLYPGNGGDGFHNGPLLLQYIGAGGQLLEDGSISNVEALEAVFEFLVEGRIRGIIPSDVAEFASLDAVWTTFVNRGSGVAASAADTFLENRDSTPQVHYGQVPTRNGLPTTVADTWAFIVLTQDPAQREQVMALLKHLMAPNTQGTWGQYTHRLPSSQDALAEWSTPDEYRDFLNRQLEIAVALPNGRAFADFSRRLQTAQAGVLRGELTADEAITHIRSSE